MRIHIRLLVDSRNLEHQQPVENTRRAVTAVPRSHKGDVAKTSIARHFGGRNCREGERGIVNRADPAGTAWDGSG
jgi:hypothetical protein